MGTTNGQVITPPAGSSFSPVAEQRPATWLMRRRGLVIAVAVVAAAAALALGEHWLAIADLVPLFFVLPCAAMMFMCMKGMRHGERTDTTQIAARNNTPTASDVRN